ncbi:MAG: hypothetical protein CL610_13650 [Anaerolineaceae bacterium]|nr:hypothetical protein [Anaerolineaceae bacterium]
MVMMTDSVFEIKAPQLYRCQVYRYFSGLSRLYLSVFKPQQNIPAFYVLFSDVGYFEGPMNWQSVDFYIAPPQACIDLMLHTGIIGPAVLQFPDAYASITDTARLYRVDTGQAPVQIIASSASLLDSVPSSI